MEVYFTEVATRVISTPAVQRIVKAVVFTVGYLTALHVVVTYMES